MIEFLGFYAAMLAFLVYYIRFIGRHGWAVTLCIGTALPVVCVFFFDIAMRIVLPKGYSEPLLIFLDIQGFSHGVRFLVLAIGIYGISEMLWTMNASRGKSSVSKVEFSFASMINALIRSREAWRGTLIGSVIGFFVGILPAAGAPPHR